MDSSEFNHIILLVTTHIVDNIYIYIYIHNFKRRVQHQCIDKQNNDQTERKSKNYICGAYLAY